MRKYIFFLSIVFLFIGCGGEDDDFFTSMTPNGEKVISVIGTSSPKKDSDISLVEVANIPLYGNALDLVLSEDGCVAYIATGEVGFVVVDLYDPYRPAILESYFLQEYANRISLTGDSLSVSYTPELLNGYFATSSFDVSSPLSPEFISTQNGYNNPKQTKLTVDNRLYLLDSDGFKVFDISSSIDPKEIASYPLFATAYSFAIYGDMIYIANGTSGLKVLKIESNF